MVFRLLLQDERGRTSPTSYAKTTACTRSRRPSFRSTEETCVFTVASVSTSREAISAFDSASATKRSTSTSRPADLDELDRKSTRLNSSHLVISYAVFCLKKKNKLTHSSTR